MKIKNILVDFLNKKSFLLKNQAQGSMFSFFTIVLGVILAVAFLPILDTLVGQVSADNITHLSMGSIILMLLGMSGVFLIILMVMSWISDFQQKQTYIG